MIKVKNVRPGVVIIADVRLKLSPGETAEVDVLTKQMEQALAEGLLAKVDLETDSRSRARTAPKANPSKTDTKPEVITETIPASKPGDAAKLPMETASGTG